MKVLLLLLLTAVLWGSTPIIEKMGLVKADPLTAVTIRSFAVAIVLVVYLALSGKLKATLSVNPRTILIFSISGIMAGLLGMLTYFAALRQGAASNIVPISATYPLISAFLSVLILGEQITPLRILGTALIVTGVWLVRM